MCRMVRLSLLASAAWLALGALSPLGYLPLGEWLTVGTWHDPVWTRALEHGLTVALLAVSAVRTKVDRREPSGNM